MEERLERKLTAGLQGRAANGAEIGGNLKCGLFIVPQMSISKTPKASHLHQPQLPRLSEEPTFYIFIDIVAIIIYIVYTTTQGSHMQTAARKVAKHFRLDETLIKNAKKILGAKTETETIESALSDVIYQERMRKFIEQTKGKFKFEGLD
jgi:hypothetical protein